MNKRIEGKVDLLKRMVKCGPWQSEAQLMSQFLRASPTGICQLTEDDMNICISVGNSFLSDIGLKPIKVLLELDEGRCIDIWHDDEPEIAVYSKPQTLTKHHAVIGEDCEFEECELEDYESEGNSLPPDLRGHNQRTGIKWLKHYNKLSITTGRTTNTAIPSPLASDFEGMETIISIQEGR